MWIENKRTDTMSRRHPNDSYLNSVYYPENRVAGGFLALLLAVSALVAVTVAPGVAVGVILGVVTLKLAERVTQHLRREGDVSTTNGNQRRVA